jgi:hypothetical protein
MHYTPASVIKFSTNTRNCHTDKLFNYQTWGRCVEIGSWTSRGFSFGGETVYTDKAMQRHTSFSFGGETVYTDKAMQRHTSVTRRAKTPAGHNPPWVVFRLGGPPGQRDRATCNQAVQQCMGHEATRTEPLLRFRTQVARLASSCSPSLKFG